MKFTAYKGHRSHLCRIETDNGLTQWDNVPVTELYTVLAAVQKAAREYAHMHGQVTMPQLRLCVESVPSDGLMYLRYRGHTIAWQQVNTQKVIQDFDRFLFIERVGE